MSFGVLWMECFHSESTDNPAFIGVARGQYNWDAMCRPIKKAKPNQVYSKINNISSCAPLTNRVLHIISASCMHWIKLRACVLCTNFALLLFSLSRCYWTLNILTVIIVMEQTNQSNGIRSTHKHRLFPPSLHLAVPRSLFPQSLQLKPCCSIFSVILFIIISCIVHFTRTFIHHN